MSIRESKSRSDNMMEKTEELNVEGQMALVRSAWELNKTIFNQQGKMYEKQIEKLQNEQKELKSKLQQQIHKNKSAKKRNVIDGRKTKAMIEFLVDEVKMKEKEIILLRDFVKDMKNQLKNTKLKAEKNNEELHNRIKQLEDENKLLSKDNKSKTLSIESLNEKITSLQIQHSAVIESAKKELDEAPDSLEILESQNLSEVEDNNTFEEYEDDFESDDEDDSDYETDNVELSPGNNETVTLDNKHCNIMLPSIDLNKKPGKSILKPVITKAIVNELTGKIKRHIKFDKTTYYQMINDENTVSYGNFVDALKPPGDILFGMFDGKMFPTEESNVDKSNEATPFAMKHLKDLPKLNNRPLIQLNTFATNDEVPQLVKLEAPPKTSTADPAKLVLKHLKDLPKLNNIPLVQMDAFAFGNDSEAPTLSKPDSKRYHPFFFKHLKDLPKLDATPLPLMQQNSYELSLLSGTSPNDSASYSSSFLDVDINNVLDM